MILKIERYDSDQQWWMFDNIRKISISTPLLRRNRIGINYDVTIFDTPKSDCECEDEVQCNRCEKYLVACCRLTDYSEILIAFDTLAYLCNDEGKTIEKIIANYKD